MNKGRNLFVRIGVLLIGILSLTWAFQARPRNALGEYRTALRAQGEQLTFTDLTRLRPAAPGASHETISNAVRQIGFPRYDPGQIEFRRYVSPGVASVAWLEDHPLSEVTRGGDPEVTWTDLAGQLSNSAQELEQIRSALKNPEMDAGPFTNLWGRRIDFVAIRKATHWLGGAALNELRQGKLDGALKNVEALAALARMENREYTLVAQMIRIAVASVGSEVTWEALQADGWSEPQLKRLQEAWAVVDLIEAVETGFVGERANGEAFWASFRSGNRHKPLLMPPATTPAPATLPVMFDNQTLARLYESTSLDDDYFFFLRTMQDSILAVRQLKNHKPWPEVRRRLDKSLDEVNKLGEPPRKFRYVFSLAAIPNVSRAACNAVRSETERQLTIAAIGLKRYQLRYGKMPPNLDALVPGFLATVPQDPMSGRALCFSPSPDGAFKLYSVGENQTDDGGDARSDSDGKFGLWDGRDAVWPAAAQSAHKKEGTVNP